MDLNHQHVPCNGRRIAVEVTNMTYNLLLLHQLSYLAILPPITVKHLSKVFGLNFTLQQKEAKWGLAFNVVVGKGKQELLVLIRWTIDGLIAGGGFEPPSLAKETGIIRVSNMFIVLCFPLGCFMPCQPHGVVSDISSPFTWIHVPFENSLNQRALRWCF